MATHDRITVRLNLIGVSDRQAVDLLEGLEDEMRARFGDQYDFVEVGPEMFNDEWSESAEAFINEAYLNVSAGRGN